MPLVVVLPILLIAALIVAGLVIRDFRTVRSVRQRREAPATLEGGGSHLRPR